MSSGPARAAFVLLGWAVVGALLAFGLAAAFTPFLLLSFPALGLGVLLGVRTGFGRPAWAALAGAAWVPFWIAWGNRGGPGNVCTGSATETSCSDVGNPWLWLVIGVLMLAVGLGLALGRRPRTRTPRSDPPAPEPMRLD